MIFFTGGERVAVTFFEKYLSTTVLLNRAAGNNLDYLFL